LEDVKEGEKRNDGRKEERKSRKVEKKEHRNFRPRESFFKVKSWVVIENQAFFL